MLEKRFCYLNKSWKGERSFRYFPIILSFWRNGLCIDREYSDLQRAPGKVTCRIGKYDCWFAITLEFAHICRAWRRLCKEDKIKAWMPHKISVVVQIRAFNQWWTSCLQQIRSQRLEGTVQSSQIIAVYPLRTMTGIFCILIATLIRSSQTLSIF